MTVRPAKTQISLGIRPVWSESSLSAWRKLGSLATHWAQDPDQTGQMPRLIWVFAGRIVTLLVLSCRSSNRSSTVGNNIWFFDIHQVMKLVGGAKIPWTVSCRILATTTVGLHHPMNVKRSNFYSYIYTLFLNHFCVNLVLVRWKFCKMHATEKLLTNLFSHYIKQPLSWHDISQTLPWQIKTFIYP